MSKYDEYRQTFQTLSNWDEFIIAHVLNIDPVWVSQSLAQLIEKTDKSGTFNDRLPSWKLKSFQEGLCQLYLVYLLLPVKRRVRSISSNSSPPDINALWDYQQPGESEARFRQALAQSAPQTEYSVELLTQIARAQGLQRNFAGAHATLDQAARLLEPSYRRASLRLLLERGRVHNSAGQRAQAQPLFLQAWEEARAGGEDFFAVDAAHMLGIVEPPNQQLVWNLRALELAEHSTDPPTRRWLGSLYNNIGWSYHDLGRDEEALAIFEKALAWRMAAGQPREIRIARWCIGRILRALGRTGEALAVQRSLAEEWAAVGASDGYVDEELGECLLALQRPAEAAPHFARAHKLLSQDPWLAANEPQRLERLAALGQTPAQN